jgi:quinol monooxygenase YgiN
MVATTAEGRVEARRWDDLKRAFAEALTRPEPGLVRMFLLQQRSDPTLWRVLALWRDAAALEARLASGPLRGTAVLHAAGVKHARLIVETEGQRMPE